ncbi:uncharacterized protein JN550_006358 [Neoarthrinium moseri]|uniref:uncharacterized protein n=1 Tax=Neoarthrinium moseri TaxID=1658444 RepID=UPI001FDBDE66|nr:uncharacterized protein JN550_006358 [Neoarthrinium moseri]KAI1868442.1 hypothetical protein JN550_006358 [Neoarthrinium moseri]
MIRSVGTSQSTGWTSRLQASADLAWNVMGWDGGQTGWWAVGNEQVGPEWHGNGTGRDRCRRGAAFCSASLARSGSTLINALGPLGNFPGSEHPPWNLEASTTQ